MQSQPLCRDSVGPDSAATKTMRLNLRALASPPCSFGSRACRLCRIVWVFSTAACARYRWRAMCISRFLHEFADGVVAGERARNFVPGGVAEDLGCGAGRDRRACRFGLYPQRSPCPFEKPAERFSPPRGISCGRFAWQRQTNARPWPRQDSSGRLECDECVTSELLGRHGTSNFSAALRW